MTDEAATDHARAARECADMAANSTDVSDALGWLAMSLGQIATATEKVAADSERTRKVADQAAAIGHQLGTIDLPPGVAGMIGFDPSALLSPHGE